jgi:uncharacterized protein (TIGR00270 family)
MSFVCEICGRVVDRAYVVLIDGAEFIVCDRCKRYGKVIKVLESKDAKSLLRQSETRAQTKTVSKPTLRSRSPDSLLEDELVLVPDYGERIREEREKRKLSIEELARSLGISSSYLRRIEHQKVIPDEKTIQKIEEFFGINLRTRDTLVDVKVSDQEINYTPTLGDFIVLEDKRKKEKR